MMKLSALVLTILLTAASATAQTTRPATTRPADKTTGDMKFMSADQVFEQMGKPTTRPARQLESLPESPVHDRKGGAGAVKPDAPRVTLIREGSLLIDRLGRVTHTDKGQAEFVFESDGKALRDPPMLLLPNLTLVQIEEQINASNRDIKIRVTGLVTEYKGRNYLLLEKIVVPFDVSQQF